MGFIVLVDLNSTVSIHDSTIILTVFPRQSSNFLILHWFCFHQVGFMGFCCKNSRNGLAGRCHPIGNGRDREMTMEAAISSAREIHSVTPSALSLMKSRPEAENRPGQVARIEIVMSFMVVALS